jgi:dTDP-4-dehydrorhamnose 3,5-epimerase
VRFIPLPLGGAFEVLIEPVEDERGFNARVWDAEVFGEMSLPNWISQVNMIRSRHAGSLRGMHWQVPPVSESKLFRVTSGAIFDAIVDLRRGSPTYRQVYSTTLRAGEHRMLFVPEGFAQGFQALENDTEITYQVTAAYSPEHGRGFRFDDPAFAIPWPLEVTTVSEKDRSWPPFSDAMAISLPSETG